MRRSRTFRWRDNQISEIPVAIFALTRKSLRRARAAAEAPLGINGQGGNEFSGVFYYVRAVRGIFGREQGQPGGTRTVESIS